MTSLSRRDFLRLGATGLLGLGLSPTWLADRQPIAVGRVMASTVRVFDRPRTDGKIVASFYSDNLLPIFGRQIGTRQPANNRLWYRLAEGYVHSSWVQWVLPRSNAAEAEVPEGGFLGEVTAPFVDARRRPSVHSQTIYRLYYSSVHWVRTVLAGEDGGPWYKLYDERLQVHYYVPAATLRRIRDAELEPISPEVRDKRIEVDLAAQRLTAFEGERIVLRTSISSGRVVASGESSAGRYLTPSGRFRVERKKPSRHMGYGELSAESDYELPGVPWVSYFHWSGVAFHGTYWHNDFGRPQSQGCINMRPLEARWIFRWTHPVIRPGEEFIAGEGTEVTVVR